MNKTNSYRQFVLNSVESIKEMALIPSFRINVKFTERIYGDASYPGGYTAAISNINQEYMEADIEVSKLMQKRFQEMGPRYVQEDLAHEIAHILTEPYYDLLEKRLGKKFSTSDKEEFRKMNEHQTQMMGMIISKLIPISDQDKKRRINRSIKIVKQPQ